MGLRWQPDRGKERFWRQMMTQWRRSGQTVRDFCATHGLSEPSFYGWRRTIAQRDHEAAAAQSANCKRNRTGRSFSGACPNRRTPAFVPVRVLSATAIPLEVVLGRGRVIRVPSGFDAGTLRQLLAVLDEESSC
jgi:hypothetical protein